MGFGSWYERQPERLQRELDEFKRAGLELNLREDLLGRHGIVVLEGTVEPAGGPVRLSVLYPPGFPNYRPEVLTDDVTLARHQNPFERNLCVIPHDDGAWNPNETGVMMVQQAIALIETSLQGPAAVAEREVAAPEPASAWYPFTAGDSLLILRELPDVAPGAFGNLKCILQPDYVVKGWLRAILTEVSSTALDGSWRLTDSLPQLAGQPVRTGTWISVAEPPPVPLTVSGERGGANELIAWAVEKDPNLAYRLRKQREKADGLELLGIVYPEETLRRGEYHPNFLLTVRQRYGAPKLLRPYHYTPSGRQERIPELAGLDDKKVLVVGLGALGSPLVRGLARAGVGHLGLVDHDVVDTGPLVRQEFDLQDVGLPKFLALERSINQINPWIKVEKSAMMVGGSRDVLDLRNLPERDPLVTFAEQIRDYDLLISTTGTGVDRVINEMGAAYGIPRLFSWVLNGAWGGRIFRATPGQACYDCFAYSWEDFPSPPEDVDGAPLYPRGCGFPTFTGSGFDAAVVAHHAVRVAVQTLLRAQPGAYPDSAFNLLNITNRTAEEGIPEIQHFTVPRQEQCRSCRTHPS